MWPGRGLTGGNRQSRKDILRLGARRVPRCAQWIRDVASEAVPLAGILEDLTTIGPCSHCAEAILRLVEHRGFESGAKAGLELAQWARGFINSGSGEALAPTFKARAEALCAYNLRHLDIDLALSHWEVVADMAPRLAPREQADLYRWGAFVLAESNAWGQARKLVQKSRQLHRLADLKGHGIPDIEHYLGAVDVVEMYVEVSALYGRPPFA